MNCFIAIRNCAYIYACIGAIAFLLCGCESIDNLIKPDDTTLPAPTPESSTTLPTNISWLGSNYSGAQQVATLTSATITTSTISYQPCAPSSWATIKDGRTGKTLQARVCFFCGINGKLIGGFYEWAKPNDTSRSTHNLHNGYHGHVMPLHGTSSHIMLVSVDGKYRTNMIQLEWK